MSIYETRIGRIESDITTFRILSQMSWICTKLYNTALWDAKETWKKTGKILSGFDLGKTLLDSYYHSFVSAHTYQDCAHQIGNAFKTWFTLRKTDKTSHPPGFRKKEELSSFSTDRFKIINNNIIILPLTKKFTDELSYFSKKLSLKLQWNKAIPENGIIKQITIVPRKGYFELHAKILLPNPIWKTEGQVVAIDLGMRNPIVSKDEQGNIDTFKGGKILSHLRYFNKEKGRVKSEIMSRSKNKKHNSKSLIRMTKKCSAQVNQSIHAMTSTFVDLCVSRNVKEVVVGNLKGIKKNKDGTGKEWNKKSNQNWQQFPIQKVVAQLDYKLARHGIQLKKQDESWTSKGRCSLCGCTDRSKLHRVHRGLFKCENCNTIQNADVNGASNQLAKYLQPELYKQNINIQNLNNSKSSSGLLAKPLVYYWNNHSWESSHHSSII